MPIPTSNSGAYCCCYYYHHWYHTVGNKMGDKGRDKVGDNVGDRVCDKLEFETKWIKVKTKWETIWLQYGRQREIKRARVHFLDVVVTK